MIPFYRSRIRSLIKEKKQHDKRRRDGAVDEQEGIFIDETLRTVKLKLKREKQLIRSLGGKLYRTWGELQAIRAKSNMTRTSLKLTVTK